MFSARVKPKTLMKSYSKETKKPDRVMRAGTFAPADAHRTGLPSSAAAILEIAEAYPRKRGSDRESF